jgi:tetratricopeptide (TPR) repeat protein
MPHGAQIDSLASRWADRPDRADFPALADGLRKRGALSEAAAVALSGLTRFPEHIPGLVVLARIRRDEGDVAAAAAALRSALACDPSHPVVLDALANLAAATGQPSESRAWQEARDAATPVTPPAETPTVPTMVPLVPPDATSRHILFPEPSEAEDEFAEVDEPVLTESMAMLYLGQGHLERALEVFDALAGRDPSNGDLRARRDALSSELAGRRPRPYDAAVSGGRPVREWLATLAQVKPDARHAPAGYDAFFEAPAPPPEETADIGAFQAWLKELGR